MPSVSPSPAAPSLWLSILIPVYNVEAYLAECVESIMQQADEGVEILLVLGAERWRGDQTKGSSHAGIRIFSGVSKDEHVP